MTVTTNITESDVLSALRTVIIGVIDCDVVQGLDNNVPMPQSGFISLTPITQNRLSTNTESYSETDGTKTITQALQYGVQIDCYGDDASTWAWILTTILRDGYACLRMPANIQPMYATDPQMAPIVDGENQYNSRWLLTAVLQANVSMTFAQDFFNEASVSTYATGDSNQTE